MVTPRKTVAICWRADDPHVNPPKLPGGYDVCSKCGERIYVADKTRIVMNANPGMTLWCHVCTRDFKGEKNLIRPTNRQRKILNEMEGKE